MIRRTIPRNSSNFAESVEQEIFTRIRNENGRYFREKLSRRERYKQFKRSNERRLFKIQLNVAPIPRNTQKIVLEWANIFVHRSHGRELIFTRLPSPGWF